MDLEDSPDQPALPWVDHDVCSHCGAIDANFEITRIGDTELRFLCLACEHEWFESTQ